MTIPPKSPSTGDLPPGDEAPDLQLLLNFLVASRQGDFSVRCPTDREGLAGTVYGAANAMADQLAVLSSEVTRVARQVGIEGRLGGQADAPGASGAWKEMTDNVNLMSSNLTSQLRNIAEVTTAVASGDLSTRITVDVDGEILDLKNTINRMVNQLGQFASEAARVTRESGREGRVEAKVQGAAGMWKDLTLNVNSMASNLSGQEIVIAGASRKSAELMRVNETLEQQVEERTRELVRAEKRYRSIFENSSEGVYQTDANGRYVMANPAMARILGYASPAELMEKVTNVGTQVYEEPRCREEFLRAAREHGAVENFEYKAIRKDGSRIWISENSRVLLDDAGEAIGHEGMAIDFTKRKNADQIIATRQRDLETLLYVISHDLREPLRAIVGYSTLVLERNREKLDEQAIDFLGRVTSSTTRLESLLNDVQMLIRAQRMAPPKDEVNCAHLVREAITLLQGKIDETGARIRVSENLPRLCLDSTWARQAIYNLVANALKFTAKGEKPDIEIVEYVPKEGADPGGGIIVRDRGTGVKPRNAKKIFELFKREVGRDVEGTGAGLAIVSAVAQRHNGAAWLEHREGGGTDFIITFGPVSPPCDEKAPAGSPDAILAE